MAAESASEVMPGLELEAKDAAAFRRFNRWFATIVLVVGSILAVLYEVQIYCVKIDPPIADYLATLRESSVPGCSSFGLRKPSLLVVGDSHSYAGWNFNVAAEKLGRDDIGACTLSGFRMKTWSLLMPRLERDHAIPRVIVFGASPLQFYPATNHEDEQLAMHEKVLRGRAVDQFWELELGTGLRWVLGNVRNTVFHKMHPYKYPQLEKTLKLHQPLVEGISEARIPKVLAEYPVPSRIHVPERLAEEVPAAYPEIERLIADLCAFVKKNDVSLYVLALPESPFLTERYTPAQQQYFESNLAQLSKCATAVIHEPAESYGLGNRHYVNRLMFDNYPYDLFHDDAPLPPPDSVANQSYFDNYFFDLDHLNLVGATKITPLLVQKLVDRGLLDRMGPKPKN